MTMKERWEWSLVLLIGAPPLAGYVMYVVVREWLVWRGPRYFVKTHFPTWLPKTPIYGPADPYRTNGPQAKPNLRVVS